MTKMVDSALELDKAFRLAMRGFAGSVGIVTAASAGQRYAMTLTSAMSLSMDPLSVVVAVNRSASIHEALSEGVDFCLNVLDVGQTEIATACSSSKERDRRFELAEFGEREGVPYLTGAQASLFCVQDGQVNYGTHDLWIGKVVAASATGKIAPLVYVEGRFASLQS